MVTNVLIIIVSVSGAIVFLYGVSRTSPAHSRKESNDFTGAVVAVIGTTYAVLLAFMLSNVWNMFQQAEINAEQEANDVVNVFRLASLLQVRRTMTCKVSPGSTRRGSSRWSSLQWSRTS